MLGATGLDLHTHRPIKVSCADIIIYFVFRIHIVNHDNRIQDVKSY